MDVKTVNIECPGWRDVAGEWEAFRKIQAKNMNLGGEFNIIIKEVLSVKV